MIGHVRGKVIERGAGFILLDVLGIGYKVYTTAADFEAIEPSAEVALYTHLAVREDALTLFGFREKEDLRFFELLLSVSGIGPKSALAILSLTDTKTLASAIRAGESSYLTKISGIGKKNAGKIILELKDKLGEGATKDEGVHVSSDAEVLEALESLGYGVREIREVIQTLPPELSGTGERLKEALKKLSRG